MIDRVLRLSWALLLSAPAAAACDPVPDLAGVHLGDSFASVASNLATGAKLGAMSGKGERRERRVEFADGRRLLLVAQGHDEQARIFQITLIVPKPPEGGDRFLAQWVARWGKPRAQVQDRERRSDALSEAMVWLDLDCGSRALALVRREITPRGAVLRYGAVQLSSLSQFVDELRGLEQAADQIAGF